MTSEVQLVADSRDVLGECPLWCDRTQALWWTDIEGKRLARWDAESGKLKHIAMPERVGSFALCEDADHLLVGFASGIALYDLRANTHTPIVPVEADIPGTRINDGRCDPQGRFVFGMFQPGRIGDISTMRGGSFYRVNHDLTVERLPIPKAAVANSICFSPDGSTLYFADSPARTIWCAPYAADGSIGEIREFVRLKDGDGFPDGSCVDAQGGLWNAQWQGSGVVRYEASGRETDRIALPVSQPTCPTFGGPALQHLFVTSARVGLQPEARASQPQAGGLLRLATKYTGLPERRFHRIHTS